VRLSYAMTAIVMFAGFVVIPNIAAYLQLNLGVPREHLKYAYLFGGLASLVTTQAGGRLVDRFGSARVGAVGASLVIVVVYAFFYLPWSGAPSWVVFLAFVGVLVANGLRNVSYTTLASRVPEPEVRARFQSLQSAVQHGSSAVAAVVSAQLLSKVDRPAQPGREPFILAGMDRVALVSMSLSLVIPLMMRVVERRLSARQRLTVTDAALERG
jgi:predicted MFS family arabinose efflux permease